MRSGLLLSLLALAGAWAMSLTASAARAEVLITDYFANKEWTLYEQTDDGLFSQCIAKKLPTEDNTRLQMGRNLYGDDFMLVYGINELIAPGQVEGDGRILINGKEAYDYSKMAIYESVAEPGSKYISIFFAFGFIDKLAAANSITIEFARGRAKHSLKGSKAIIEKFDACMDSGLAKEAAIVSTPRAPDGWTSDKADGDSGGAYFAIDLPGQDDGQPRAIALVERGEGRYDIRLRANIADVAFAISPANGAVRRFAAQVQFSGAPAQSIIAMIQGSSIDLPDLSADTLRFIPRAGTLKIKSLEPGDNFEIITDLTADVSAGAQALVSPGGSDVMDIDNLAGPYLVRGRNPNGKYYYGTADVSYLPGQLHVKWVWTNKSEAKGQANAIGNVITAVVEGLTDPVIYTIGKDGIWRGTWQQGQGTEIMVPKRY